MNVERLVISIVCVAAISALIWSYLRRGVSQLTLEDVLASELDGKSIPESLHRVTLTDTHLRHESPNGDHETIAWPDLTQIDIQTTDEGPMLPDVFWILHTAQKKLEIPHGATGDKELLERLLELPDFDSEQFSAAMGSTSNNVFVCWRSKQKSGEQDPA